MAVADCYADARRAAMGEWKKPRMKIYDYNQEYGGNYYQPMIQYIYSKEIEGPYHTRQEVYLPDKCEVVSNKYTNMMSKEGDNVTMNMTSTDALMKRYNDRSATDVELERFLTKAYKKQINEVNSATAYARNELMRNSKLNTLLYPKPTATVLRDYYVRELQIMKDKDYSYFFVH